MKTVLFMSAALALAAAACGGTDATITGDENDVKGTSCAPATTLTCAQGFVVTTTGCASPRFVGAPTYGRCVSADQEKLVGTWGEDASGTNVFYSYTFNADNTYTATGGCRPNPHGPSCFAITHASGKWAISKSGPQLGAPGGASELVLTDSFNQKDTFFYSLDGKKLSLSTIFRGEASVFEKN